MFHFSFLVGTISFIYLILQFIIKVLKLRYFTGYNDILLIPAGATNIKVEEIAPTNNYLGTVYKFDVTICFLCSFCSCSKYERPLLFERQLEDRFSKKYRVCRLQV